MKHFLAGLVAGAALCVAAQAAYAAYDMIKFMDKQMGKLK